MLDFWIAPHVKLIYNIAYGAFAELSQQVEPAS